ncbi:MAG TPA: hypothetical protein VFZ52_14055 [Chryseolinea sp.]
MSEVLAHYGFIPWLRQGIGSKITETDALGNPSATMAKERADLQIGVTVESTDIADESKIETELTKTVKMFGPPDVLAISESAIVRTEPKPKVNNYESNGLPYIEFYTEDFLWTYTPASAGTGTNAGRLTPWLALICLKDDEFELKNNTDGRPYITIPSDKITEVFHDPTQHWAWGHVHMNTDLSAATVAGKIDEVTAELDANPDSGVCRLLCPRKLIKETQYTAFLIPAFETGRLARLGLPYTDILAQKMSWGGSEADYTTKPRGTDYPVYHLWTFRTGQFGDFESLARILKAVVTEPELGKRPMYIAEAGYGLDDIEPASKVLGLEGALKPPDFVSDPWTNGAGDVAYRQHLRKLLNLSIDNEKKQTDKPAVSADSLNQNPFYSATLGDDPIVTPHVYGRWHALIERLQANNNHPWINTLNLDPRNRAAAGLGVNVVQKNQEDYMRRAWKQVEQVNEANARIRKASLSKLISYALFNKHLKNVTTDQAIRMTNPMHNFVIEDGSTVQHAVTKSLVPNASKSGAFAKITRPGKKSNKKINAFANPGANLIHQKVIPRFNSEVITAAKDKVAPALAINIAEVTSAIGTSISNFQATDTAMAQQAMFDILMEEIPFTDLTNGAKKNQLKAKVDNYPDLNATSRNLAKGMIDGIQSSTAGSATTSNTVVIEGTAYKAVFGEDITAKTYDEIIISRETVAGEGQIGRATLLQDIKAFESAFTGFDSDIIGNLATIPKGEALANVNTFSAKIIFALQPKQVIVNRVANSIKLKVFDPATQTHKEQPLEDLRPIMAHPKFDDPMFRNLKQLSQEFILPNIDKVPENSITLMETNQAFIEAYMAGLNHEMSRELLWREYPTDQRGTYFRQFWDISDNIFEADREKKYDIKKMHEWDKELGAHTPRVITNPSGSVYLVLLIRGELLKKYPNTQVYAQKAAFKNVNNPAVPRALADANVEGNIKVPVFFAELDPDIYLFGFDLDEDEAKGDSSDATKPGWFFVLRERPGQIRFGLDDWTPTDPDDPAFPTSDPANWNDLSWEHLVSAPSELNNYHIDAEHAFTSGTGSENVPLATWGKNSADMAYILYQNPVLFARHGQEMLPD